MWRFLKWPHEGAIAPKRWGLYNSAHVANPLQVNSIYAQPSYKKLLFYDKKIHFLTLTRRSSAFVRFVSWAGRRSSKLAH